MLSVQDLYQVLSSRGNGGIMMRSEAALLEGRR